MEKVTGIGGIFFKVRDPERMAAWCREHLGIGAEDGHADFAAGRTVWSLFPADTDYFGRAPERGLSQSAARRQTRGPRNHPSRRPSFHPLRVGTTRAPLKNVPHCPTGFSRRN
jgi:hypothetical protein